MSALATRGHYDMPSDSIHNWPEAYGLPFDGNPDYTVSSYDHRAAYWGSTHEETWKVIKKHDFISGVFVWTGFDYLGEPAPYPWPARSSYFGIVDLAGFPKDAYYLYQSEWKNTPVLHIFPHWNWEEGKTVDVWAYYNNADEVELYLNGKSLGVKKKQNDDMHVMWRVKYQPGKIKAISRKNAKTVLTRENITSGNPAKIEMTADRTSIKADGYDLAFITVRITDSKGITVPDADNLVSFNIKGEGIIAGVDNGYQASLEPFKANYRKAYNGLCLVIIKSKKKAGKINLKAESEGLKPAYLTIESKKNSQ
jgi:beta-galactosidase